MRTQYKRYLPHITPPGGTFFITAMLKDALPVAIIRKLKAEKYQLIEDLKKKEGKHEEIIRQHKLYFQKFDSLLDKAELSVQYLKQPEVAEILVKKMLQYNNVHYQILGYCIMSNHLHLLIDTSIQLINIPIEDPISAKNHVPLSKIMKLIKGGSAFEINKYLNQKGAFWQIESYDHLVRNEKELMNIIRYIANNPVKAGLVNDWKDFSFTYIHPDWLALLP